MEIKVVPFATGKTGLPSNSGGISADSKKSLPIGTEALITAYCGLQNSRSEDLSKDVQKDPQRWYEIVFKSFQIQYGCTIFFKCSAIRSNVTV